MGKWADLPIELVECMEKYLDFVEKVRIRAVCASWNSHLPAVPKLISKDLPWLLLEDSSKGASLYNVHESKLYFLNLPELRHKFFRGSSCGWIITLEDENSSRVDDIFAFNPLTRARIKFPPRSAFPDVQDYDPDRVGEEYIMKEPDYPVADPDPEPDSDPEPEADPEPELEPEPESELESDPKSEREYDPISCKSWVNYSLIKKVVLSSSPSSNDCIAVAIYGEYLQLAWCRPHHNKWTSFYDYSCHRSHNGVADVIFYNGKLHALYNDGKLEIYKTIDPQVTVQQVVAPHIENPHTLVLLSPLYLAVCHNLGIIYASRRIRSSYKDRVTTVDTEWIYLYNLVESSMKDGSKSWVELDGLGDNILFVGLNMSYSVLVSDEFKSLGYERNRAYFTDHYLWNRKSQDDSDMGLLDFDGSFTDGLPGFEVKPEFFWPPPIWVTPSAI